MTRYQLVKIVAWAGTFHSRKRLQKLVFLLQQAGCPLDADFILHHYGPYSEELSRLTDELVRLHLLDEVAEDNSVGQQFSYRLSEQAGGQLAQLEQTDRGRQMAAQMAPYEGQARALLDADLKELEVAATILYFQRRGHDWPEAVERTCVFKGIAASSALVGRAEKMARAVEKANGTSAA
jgi:uncharacterized protein YwgA